MKLYNSKMYNIPVFKSIDECETALLSRIEVLAEARSHQYRPDSFTIRYQATSVPAVHTMWDKFTKSGEVDVLPKWKKFIIIESTACHQNILAGNITGWIIIPTHEMGIFADEAPCNE